MSNWVSSYYDGLAASGAFLMPYDVRDQLTAIPYGDNFRVEVVGNNASEARYTLYRSDFLLNDEAEYYNLDTLKIPDEQGEYIASVHIMWHNGMPDQKYKSEGYQYLFMISV